MLFSSITFLYYFLPLVLVIYFAAPRSLKNTVLLISSLFFYGWGEPRFVVLMAATVTVGYICGLAIEAFRGRPISKVFLALSVTISLAGLMYFKYADFFIENFNAVTGMSIPFLRLALPIGISFYTFQILSYTVDVYRGHKAQKNFINLAMYIAFFPQLIAGPIVRYTDIENQLVEREHSFDKAAEGCKRFIIGFSKKILIANTLGELCTAFNSSTDTSVLYHWIFVISYMLQIYFDFSGYSDMAIGLGKIFGFDFSENFNYPFISGSITEFWRRWHISLGSWFRDYVYIPMGGNRVKKSRMLLNIFTVWFLTGFWHGAEWNFIIWGLYFGILLTAEKFLYKDFLKKHQITAHFYLLFTVSVSFMIFASEGMGQALNSVSGMFGAGSLAAVSTEAIYNLLNYGVIIIIACIGATPLPKRIKAYADSKFGEYLPYRLMELVLSAVLLLICTAYLADGSFNPFLYFRF